MSRVRWLVVALAWVLPAAVGCTTVVSGTGRAAPAGSGAASPSPSPSQEVSAEVKLLRGKVREAHRLAGVVQRPDMVFRQFNRGCAPTGTFYSPDSLTAFGGVFPDNAVPALREGGYITGYAQCRQSGTARSLISAAFEMKDAAACREAVRKLAAALREKGALLSGIAGFADSYAVELVNQRDTNDPTRRTNMVQRMVRSCTTSGRARRTSGPAATGQRG